MYIIKPDLKWKTPPEALRLAEVDGVSLHHAEHASADIFEIHRWHLENGWRGVGYNYFIDKQGRIHEGRGLNFGAHTAYNNGHLLGVCFQGDFNEKDKAMSDEQFNAGIALIKWLKQQVPSIKTIDGHKHWRPTACPGKYFPLDEMLDFNERVKVKTHWGEPLIRGMMADGTISSWHEPEDKVTWAELAAVVKNLKEAK